MANEAETAAWPPGGFSGLLAGHTGYGANSRCSRVLRSPGLATMLSLGSLPLPGFSHGLFRGSLSPTFQTPSS